MDETLPNASSFQFAALRNMYIWLRRLSHVGLGNFPSSILVCHYQFGSSPNHHGNR
jgi:hypothetical protein